MSTIPSIAGNAGDIMAAVAGSQVDPTKGGDINYCVFDAKRTGDWLVGKAREPVTGERIAIDLSSWRHGYHRWHQKKLTDVMVSPTKSLADIEPPETIEWEDDKGKTQYSESNEARSFEFQFVDGDDEMVYEFATATYGGRKAVDSVWTEIVMRAQAQNPFMFPVVELATDHYDHQTYGKTFTPELNIVGWYDAEGNPEGDALAAPETADAEPAAQTEEAPEKEAPRRRRRRKAS